MWPSGARSPEATKVWIWATEKNCCARSGTLVSRFSSLVFKTAEKCDALLSVYNYCVDDTSLKISFDTRHASLFTLARSDLKFRRT